MRDLQRELEEQGQGWPAAWVPQPGETLVGTVRQFAVGPGKFGGDVRTVIIEREGSHERVSVWLSSKVLQSLFAQHSPQVGERIGLRFLGIEPGKSYKKFSMVVDRAPSFEPLGGETEDAEDTPASTPFADIVISPPAPAAARTRPAPSHDASDPFNEE